MPSLALSTVNGSMTSIVHSGLFLRYSSRVEAMLPCSMPQGIPRAKQVLPISFEIMSALKWSRTMEEPTNATSMSLRALTSAMVSAA